MKKTVYTILFALFCACFIAACVDQTADRRIPSTDPSDTTGKIVPLPDPADTTSSPTDTIPDPIDTTVTPIDTIPEPIDTTAGPTDTIPDPIDTTVTPVDTIPVTPPVGKTYDTMVLRIMDYNVGRLHKELAAEQTAPMIGKMINELNVDAVTVQELDSCRDGSGRFQLKYLVNNIPNGSSRYNYFFGSNIAAGTGGRYGIGVIMDKKYKVVNKYHVCLPKYDGAEIRGFCVMESEHFVVICTHLDHKSIEARQNQMLDINREVMARYKDSGKLVFLAGDFNGNQNGGVVINAKKAWTRVSSDDYTSTAKNPKNTIDHMFILNNGVGFKVHTAKAVKKFVDSTLDVKQASDHLPIFIEFEFYIEKKQI